jgi:hypothetical protein
MHFLTILSAVGFLVAACGVGLYVWRGFKNGKILVGIRGGLETWMVRSEDSISYWIVMFMFLVVVVGLVWLAVAPLVGYSK